MASIAGGIRKVSPDKNGYLSIGFMAVDFAGTITGRLLNVYRPLRSNDRLVVKIP